MLKLLARLGRKASAATRLHVNAVRGTNAVWTPRKFDQLVKEGYQQAVWAYACVSWLTRMVRPTVWVVQVGDDEVDDHPLARLLGRPNPFQGGGSFLEGVYGFTLTSGNAYIERVGTERRPPTELWVKRPDRMRVIPDPVELVRGYEYTVGQDSVRFDRWQMRHLRTWHPLNDWYGMSPLEAAARGIDLFNEGAAHNLALIQNGARPSGAWVTQGTLGDEQFERLKAELDDTLLSPRERGRPLLLEGGTTWQELGLNPKDLDYLAGQEDAARQIHAAFGVHPVITGLSEGTFENQRQAMRSLMVNSVLPWLDYFTSELNDWLAPLYGPRVRLAYDRDAFPAVSEDQESIWARADTGWSKGFLTRNEARALVGYDEVEPDKGDIFVSEMYGPERQVPGLLPPPRGDDVEPEERGVVRARKGAFRLTTDADRADYWRSRVALQDEWIDRLEREVASIMNEERVELGRRLASVTDEAGALAAARETFRADRWEERMLPWVLAIMQAGGESALGDLAQKGIPGIADSFPATFGLVFTEAIEHARAHTAKLAGQVTTTTLDRVTRSVHAGVSEGLSMPHIAERVDDRLLDQIIPGQSRATVIARTETIRASNYGSQAAAKGTGLTLTKVWLATLDGRQRDSHGGANGQKRPLDSPYNVGGWSLMYPGDPNGPAEEVIQCRCTEYYEEIDAVEPEHDLEDVDEFVPATSKKDAEAYAVERFRMTTADYSKLSLDAANDMNATISGLRTRYGSVPLQAIQPYRPAVLAMGGKPTADANVMYAALRRRQFSPSDELTIRLGYSAKNAGTRDAIASAARDLNTRGFINGVDARGFLVHEYGHTLDGHLTSWVQRPDGRWMARVPSQQLREALNNATAGAAEHASVVRAAGEYAGTSASEFFAEAFRLYDAGRLPVDAPTVAEFFRRLIP